MDYNSKKFENYVLEILSLKILIANSNTFRNNEKVSLNFFHLLANVFSKNSLMNYIDVIIKKLINRVNYLKTPILIPHNTLSKI